MNRIVGWTTEVLISKRKRVVIQGYPLYLTRPTSDKFPKKIKRGTNGRKNKRRRFPNKRKRIHDKPSIE